MKCCFSLIKRNCKLFFKDKGMFFTALITPLILLLLYATFLANIYRDSFASAMPEGFAFDESIIDATVGGQLISSLLAVSCVTVAFCSNLMTVQDKVTGALKDLTVSPVRKSALAVSYFAASALVTLIVSVTAFGICMLYLAKVGWYMSLSDVLLMLADVLLLTLFGTALASCVNFPLSTNGQASAVGTVISACYGFICGAYMPISNFSDGLQRALMFLPGTYGTSLLRSHAMNGVFEEMKSSGFPDEIVKMIGDSIDCNIYFSGNEVSIYAKYFILVGSTAVLIGLYVLLNCLKKRSRK